MSAVGPADFPNIPFAKAMTEFTAQITVGAGDIPLSSVFNAGWCRRVYCNAAGTVFLKRRGDAAAVGYVVTAGTALDGYFTMIGGSTNYAGASAIALTLEL